jgi:hypothetical protein
MVKYSWHRLEEKLEDTTLQDPSSAEENDLEWCYQLPPDKAPVRGRTEWAEQNWCL